MKWSAQCPQCGAAIDFAGRGDGGSGACPACGAALRGRRAVNGATPAVEEAAVILLENDPAESESNAPAVLEDEDNLVLTPAEGDDSGRPACDHPSGSTAAGREKVRFGAAQRRKSSGAVHAGHAIVFGLGAGLVIGAALAAILGGLFGEGNTFEFCIYAVAGVVLGTASGGAVGVAVALFLPKPSRNESAEQVGGLLCVAGGFLVVAAGIVAFGILGTMNGAESPHMPRFAAQIYGLVGRWGVLLLLAIAGVALGALGVRTMMARRR